MCIRDRGKERKGRTVKHIGSTEALAQQVGLARECPENDRDDFLDADPSGSTARNFVVQKLRYKGRLEYAAVVREPCLLYTSRCV